MSEDVPQSSRPGAEWVQPASPEHLFAMFLKLQGRRCVVVGGGAIAEGKIGGLLQAGAVVTVIAPQVTPRIAAWAGEECLAWQQREFSASDLQQAFLVISATDDSELNTKVFAEADARGILCNAVDDPEHCHFYFPSVVDRGPLQIAISTTGYSPALAQRLRRELEAQYGEEYADWVRSLGAYRSGLFADGNLDPERRRELLHRAASHAEFRACVDHGRPQLEPTDSRLGATGKVYLVGAGPGDPELLTVKAARLIQAADVVLYDDLVGPEVLSLAQPGALVQNVGKRAGVKHFPQADINDLLIQHARAGKRVVRLKGGDPLLFGRAGEEMDALRQAGLRFEIVPGVTAALGAAASAEIPLTDRRLASSVILASGHACAGNAPTDWAAVIRTGATIVVYMPGDHQALATALMQAGLDEDTPCAVVAQASLPGEQTQRTSLRRLSEADRPMKPNLLVIGAVAAARLATRKDASASEHESAEVQEQFAAR